MESELRLRYKQETGNRPVKDIETLKLTLPLDSKVLSDFNAVGLRNLIDLDRRKAQYGVFISDLPFSYIVYGDLKIPTPEYVKWLEDQINIKPI